MAQADKAFVYFNPKVLEHKKLPAISAEEVRRAFATENVEVFIDSQKLQARLREITYKNTALETYPNVPQSNLRSVFSIDYILPGLHIASFSTQLIHSDLIVFKL